MLLALRAVRCVASPMPDSAADLLRQELADAKVERGILVDRVVVHERTTAERDRQQAAHEVRVRAAHAKRELARMNAKRAAERDHLQAELQRQMAERAEELAVRRAAKEEDKHDKDEEIDAETAEIFREQQASIEKKLRHKMEEHETMSRILASEARDLHQAKLQQADLRLDDHRALTVLFRALDTNKNGYIEPKEFEWMLRAVRLNGPVLQPGQKPLKDEYDKRDTRHFRRLLRDFNATMSGHISIASLRKWWDTLGVQSLGIGSKALRVHSTQKTGPGSAPAFVMQTLECIRRQSRVDGATKIQTHVRRMRAQKIFRIKKAAGRLPGSRRVAAARIQSFYRMRLARVRNYCNSPRRFAPTCFVK